MLNSLCKRPRVSGRQALRQRGMDLPLFAGAEAQAASVQASHPGCGWEE